MIEQHSLAATAAFCPLRLAYAEVEQVTIRHRAFSEQLRQEDKRSRELDLRVAELDARSSRLDAHAAELDARTQHIAEILGQLAEDTGGSLAATSQALTEGLADAGRQQPRSRSCARPSTC